MYVCALSQSSHRESFGTRRALGSPWLSFFGLILAIMLVVFQALGQDPPPEWQMQVRKFAELKDWDSAMRIVEREVARAPQDLEAKTWRARILLWSGHIVESEREFRLLVRAAPQDPDLRLGLASALGREERWKEALRELDAAVEVDPKRADLHAARGRALRALGRTDDARQEFVKALQQEPASEESRAGLLSVRAEPKHELRLGTEDRKSTRLNSSHVRISYAVFCLKKKKLSHLLTTF